MSAQDGGQKAKIRRIMLALDAMNCEAALMEAAALIAAKLEAELDALFVEDADVYAVADLPITHEISLGSGRERAITGSHVEQALRCLSREAEQRFSAVTRRSRVKGEFQVTRARRGEALARCKTVCVDIFKSYPQMASTNAFLSAALKNAVPHTKVSAPTSRHSRPVSALMPPSTSMRSESPRALRQPSSVEIFSSTSRRNDWPPNPGCTLMSSTSCTLSR